MFIVVKACHHNNMSIKYQTVILKNIYNDTNFTHPCYSEYWFLVAFLLPLLFHMKEQCFL